MLSNAHSPTHSLTLSLSLTHTAVAFELCREMIKSEHFGHENGHINKQYYFF